MMTVQMTEKQRRAREALEAARGEGVSLSDYAKAHGLPIRELYDAVAALRRKGVLAKTGRAPRSKFVEVRVGPERTVGGIVCRFVHGGVVIECTQWPPPGWVAALVRPAADAAA